MAAGLASPAGQGYGARHAVAQRRHAFDCPIRVGHPHLLRQPLLACAVQLALLVMRAGAASVREIASAISMAMGGESVLSGGGLG